MTDTVLEYLQSIGVEFLDLVVASHADADHIGGLAAVIRAYRPRFFLDNELLHTTQTYADLLLAVEEAGSQVVTPTARRIGLGDAALQIISPPNDESLDSTNNSVGLVVSYRDFRAALSGDAEAPGFAWWQVNVPDLLVSVQVHKAAHHGSTNGDNAQSMTAFSPEAIVISVGEDHPDPETLALYENVGADVYRTDLQGTVVVTAAADGSYDVNAQSKSEYAAPEVIPAMPLEADPAPSSSFDPGDDDQDCGDFSSQSEAQAFYEAAGPGDPHRLDGERNGTSCASRCREPAQHHSREC